MALPAIPSLRGITDRALVSVLTPIKTLLETLSGQIGNGQDAAITPRTLNGYVQDGVDNGGIVIPPGGYDPGSDTTIPPTPTGLIAKGAIKTILLKWDDVGASTGYYNHAYAEVWRNTVNLFDGNEQQIGTAEGSVFVDETAVQGLTYYYWIRFVSQAEVTGAFNGGSGAGAQGTLGQAGQGDLAVNSIVAGDGVIGLLAVDTAMIADAAINEFKLGTGSVVNAKISGAIYSNDYQTGLTGWIINKNGQVEFNTGTFRGALAAATGTFAGELTAATGTFSGSLTASAVNAVNSLNLAGNSVTVPSSALWTGNYLGRAQAQWVAFVDMWYDHGTRNSLLGTERVGSITILVSLDGRVICDYAEGACSDSISIRLLRDGAVIRQWNDIIYVQNGHKRDYVTAIYRYDNGIDGPHRYTVEAYVTDGDTVYEVGLVILGSKR